jgi:hypothetical protein
MEAIKNFHIGTPPPKQRPRTPKNTDPAVRNINLPPPPIDGQTTATPEHNNGQRFDYIEYL